MSKGGLRFEEAWRQIAERNSRWQRGTMLPVYAETNAQDEPIGMDDAERYPVLTDAVAGPGKAPVRGFGLVVPYPPTANNYVRHTTKGHHYMTARGVAFRKRVAHLWALTGKQPLIGRLELLVTFFPKNARRHDIDNLLKPLIDALQDAGCFENDSQIDRIEVRREWSSKGGDCFVTMREYPQ